jgi:type IX secretion system PorP/SprF family membrane protein
MVNEKKNKIFLLRRLILLQLFFFIVAASVAQDIHFSQFGYSPLNTNPGNTGFFDGDVRAGGNYRSQWWDVPGLPYKSYSFFVDTRQGQKKLGSDRVGLGFLFNYDVAGDSKYGTTQLYVPLSYIKKVNKDSSFLAGISLQPGISSTGFKTAALTFETQYNGSSYDENLPSQENFSSTNQTKFDLNLGAFTQYTFGNRKYVQGGFSYYHILPQKLSYFNNTSIILHRKLNAYVNINYAVAATIDVSLELLYSRQGKFQELLSGANLKYIFETKHHQAVFIGAYIRPGDAFIGRIGMEYKSWRYSMSYDINTSGFKAATNGKGALEFGVIYILKKVVPFVPKKRVCPVYM